MTLITASMLYNLVQCPHRVAMDLFGDPVQRDEENPFVQLLWEKGQLHEAAMIAGSADHFVDLSRVPPEDRERLTLEAMTIGEPLIYGGRIAADDLLGVPDLLRKQGSSYVPIDIKSGAGLEGREDLKRSKRHYAVQLALYADILERLGYGTGHTGIIWDGSGEQVIYDLSETLGPRSSETLWDFYQSCLAQARAIVAQANETTPAASSMCKLCHWYTACSGALQDADDLTLIPELGRARRDAMVDRVPTVRNLANSDTAAFVAGRKTVFPGIGADSLEKFHARARLLTTRGAQPYLRAPVTLPATELELFFDIEVDVLRDICYLHGFVERRGGDNATERFVAFFADDPNKDEERQAYLEAWEYVRSCGTAAIYYYSSYEHTNWKKLQARYPDVCSEADIEAMFDRARAVDLYTHVVKSSTEWPTRDHSIKTLAKYLGFNWRDTHPSGAASIEWYHRWVESGDPEIRQRILDYNEDDCRATRVLLDGIRSLAMTD